MDLKEMYNNFVFDLYGTLVDIHTDENKPEFWEKVSRHYAERGAYYEPRELADRYIQLIAEQKSRLSMGAEVDLALVFDALYEEKGASVLGETMIADTAAAFRTFSMEKLRLFDGVISMLEGLKAAGKNIYLLSNAQTLFTRSELKMTGIEEYFDGILLSSDAGFKKPSLEFYGLLETRFGLDMSESLMVGNDDVADCHGAAAVGMDSLYIFTEQSPKREEPLPVNCREITEITQILDYLGHRI